MKSVSAEVTKVADVEAEAWLLMFEKSLVMVAELEFSLMVVLQI